jgi:hypothetical protein
MFNIDPSLTFIAATREQVVSIIESINHPHVGVPGHPTQRSEALVVGLRNPGGTFSIFIHLHLTESRAAVIYAYQEREFDIETFSRVEGEALEFVESMGFMVDNLNFRNLSVHQQEELMARLPCFDPDLGQAVEDEEEDDDGVLDLDAIDDLDDAPGAEILDDLEEVRELDEVEPLDEIEPLEEIGAVRSATLSPEVARRVGRLLASF